MQGRNWPLFTVISSKFPLGGIPMKKLPACLIPLASALSLSVLSSYALADVYLCTSDPCNTWEPTPLTEDQRNIKSPDINKTTIKATLENSVRTEISSAYKTKDPKGKNLYLKKDLWHKGGSVPFSEDVHVTVYIYDKPTSARPSKSCHAFSYKKQGNKNYFGTCQ